MIPNDRYYTQSHEWVKREGNIVTVGITDHAQDALGDVTFVELPAVDIDVEMGKECCIVESVKAASDIYAPVSGTIAQVNTQLQSTPELINQSPYDKGWIFKMQDFNAANFGSLLDASAYEKHLESSK